MLDSDHLNGVIQVAMLERRKTRKQMRGVILTRRQTNNMGTFGTFVLDDSTAYHSGELPWRDNQKGISSIPAGLYLCHWIYSTLHGWCYQVMNVPDRTMIELHSANFMGDSTKGFVCQLMGCIALGMDIGTLTPDGGMQQTALLESKVAIQAFELNMNQADFQLTIAENYS